MSLVSEICNHNGFSYVGHVGSGAFKETHKVLDRDGGALALKVCNNQNSPARLQREIDAMMACHHPNIARLITAKVFQYRGSKYLYMVEEFIEGISLEVYAGSSHLDRDESVALGRDLLTALSHMHALSLVHRDLKPANIVLRSPEQGGPVIVDFGIVRNLAASSLTKTFIPQGPGTPLFAPPEQLNNDKSLIDWRADQFSLAVTLAVLTSGLHPYASDKTTTEGEVVDLVARRSGPSQRHQDWASSVGLPVLVDMVRPWPSQRFRTPEELIREWENL